MLEPYEVSNTFVNLANGLTTESSPWNECLDAIDLMANAIEESGAEYDGTTGDPWNDAALYLLTFMRLNRGTFGTDDVDMIARLSEVPKAAAKGGFMSKWKAYKAGVSLDDITA